MMLFHCWRRRSALRGLGGLAEKIGYIDRRLRQFPTPFLRAIRRLRRRLRSPPPPGSTRSRGAESAKLRRAAWPWSASARAPLPPPTPSSRTTFPSSSPWSNSSTTPRARVNWDWRGKAFDGDWKGQGLKGVFHWSGTHRNSFRFQAAVGGHMAPILSLPKESLDRIREDVAPAVVSIWQVDDYGSKVSFRSGFVFDLEWNVDNEYGSCIVLTLSKDFDRSRRILVQFENGECFEGITGLDDKTSNLVAIAVVGLRFAPKVVSVAEHNVNQCDEVVHLGMFDEGTAQLHFSSGSVGLIGHNHNVLIHKEEGFTTFSHCCSQRLHLLGGPVFNLHSNLVGINYSQREKKNLFFAMDVEQYHKEVERLFGENMEHVADLWRQVKSKRRKFSQATLRRFLMKRTRT